MELMKDSPNNVILKAILDISKAASKESIRYSLNGVCLDAFVDSGNNSKLRLRACDGHILAERPLDCPEWARNLPEFIIEADSIKALKTFYAANKKNEISIVQDSDSSLVFSSGIQSVRVVKIGEKYPDTARVQPKDSKVFHKVSFNADLFYSLFEALKEDKTIQVFLEMPKDPKGPIVVYASGNRGLLMPMRPKDA